MLLEATAPCWPPSALPPSTTTTVQLPDLLLWGHSGNAGNLILTWQSMTKASCTRPVKNYCHRTNTHNQCKFNRGAKLDPLVKFQQVCLHSPAVCWSSCLDGCRLSNSQQADFCPRLFNRGPALFILLYKSIILFSLLYSPDLANLPNYKLASST